MRSGNRKARTGVRRHHDRQYYMRVAGEGAQATPASQLSHHGSVVVGVGDGRIFVVAVTAAYGLRMYLRKHPVLGFRFPAMAVAEIA
jgi:hypothetical protein